jgi:hypothetical protein
MVATVALCKNSGLNAGSLTMSRNSIVVKDHSVDENCIPLTQSCSAMQQSWHHLNVITGGLPLGWWTAEYISWFWSPSILVDYHFYIVSAFCLICS